MKGEVLIVSKPISFERARERLQAGSDLTVGCKNNALPLSLT